MARTFIIVLCLAVSACTTAPVKLRNSATGQTAQCGPYYVDGLGSNAQAEREARCVSDFQRQGYERAPD